MSDAFDFVHADKYEILPKIDNKIFWVWSSISKFSKIASLHCLYSISKKKLWIEFIMKFIKIKTYASWFINFWWKPDMSKVPKNGGLLSFCNILRKSIATVFVFVSQKHSDTLQGSSHVCCYLFLQTFQLSRFCQNSPGFWYALPLSHIESFCPSFVFLTKKMFIST